MWTIKQPWRLSVFDVSRSWFRQKLVRFPKRTWWWRWWVTATSLLPNHQVHLGIRTVEILEVRTTSYTNEKSKKNPPNISIDFSTSSYFWWEFTLNIWKIFCAGTVWHIHTCYVWCLNMHLIFSFPFFTVTGFSKGCERGQPHDASWWSSSAEFPCFEGKIGW